jgi:hypothetical protein
MQKDKGKQTQAEIIRCKRCYKERGDRAPMLYMDERHSVVVKFYLHHNPDLRWRGVCTLSIFHSLLFPEYAGVPSNRRH